MKTITPFVLGLTGGIGAGKTTCTEWLRRAGIAVFDCDAEVAALYRTSGFLADLERAVGPLGDDPRRAAVARVQADPGVLDRLYAVAEPRLQARWAAFLAAQAAAPLVVLDAPLLIEKAWDQRCDAVVCVLTGRAERLRRVLARPGMTEAKFAAIDRSQASDELRRARASFLIDGNRPRAEVLEQLEGVLHRVAALADKRLDRARRAR